MPVNRESIEQFKNLELLAKKVVEGFITGLHKSPFHGFSVEFAEHRLYNTGESTKHIDWKLFGRTDKLFVKRYEEETNLRCQVIIDNSSSMLYPADKQDNKLSFSVHAAAALNELLKQQRDAIGLTVFSDKIDTHFPAKGSPAQQKLVYSTLEELIEKNKSESKKTTAAVDVLHQIAEIVHQRSLIVIFSDMFDSQHDNDELFTALQHLKYKKNEVILFHVCDKSKEIDFDFENRPYKFIDLESGEEIKLNPNQVKENYINKIHEFERLLKLKCGQYQIDFVEADINAGFHAILYSYLIKRSSMLK